jgi:hypothetical protein
MKRIAIGLAVVFVVVLGVGVVIHFKNKAARGAIQQVINERVKAREVALEMFNERSVRVPKPIAIRRREAIAKYIAELGKIDPSACPQKFRDAWINYVQAWERQNDSFLQQEIRLNKAPTKQERQISLNVVAPSGVPIGGGGRIGSDVEQPNLHAAAEQLASEDSNEAWLTCKRVAMDYGVFVPADPF